MENSPEKNLIFSVLALTMLFLLFFLAKPQLANIHGGATTDTFTLSISIAAEENEVVVPESGNLIFSDPNVGGLIAKVTGLTAGWYVNTTLHGSAFPSAWSEPEPTSSQAGSSKFEYFEIKINSSTVGGSYAIYFNLSQSKLNSIDPAEVR